MRTLGAAASAAVFCVLGLLAASGAVIAQTPASALAPATKAAEAAEAAAAMERAQRLASNPMRVILEASKFRRKGAVDDATTVESGDTASLRRTSARVNTGGAEPIQALARRQDAVVAPMPAPLLAQLPAPLLAQQPAPLPVPVPRAAPAEPALAVTNSIPAALQEAVSALESTSLAKTFLTPLPQSAPALAARIAGQPRLVESIEPIFSGQLMDEASRLSEVLAELTIRPDGAVAQAVLLGVVPRGLKRAIVAALEQWRFEPLPAQQLHRVQLVFSGTK